MKFFCNSISNICTELVHFSTIKHAICSLRIWYSTETHGTYWVFQNIFDKIAYFLNKWNNYIWKRYNNCFCYFPDTPIHPPKSNNDPWDCEFLPNLEEYIIKPVEGVFQVYRNSADAEAGKIADGYDYPDLDTYVSDMHLMCALIGNL